MYRNYNLHYELYSFCFWIQSRHIYLYMHSVSNEADLMSILWGVIEEEDDYDAETFHAST